ncbi:MAG: ATP-binding protein [Gammaproteobacteria bacterium]
MVSAIAPVYTEQHEFIGMVGVDFHLDNLARQIEEMNFGAAGYSFMIDKRGRAIAMPDQAYLDMLGRDSNVGEFGVDLANIEGSFSQVLKAMRLGEMGMARVNDEGLDKYIAYARVAGTDWSQATVVDSKVIFADVAALETSLMNVTRDLTRTWLLPISLALLVVVSSIGMFFAYRLTAPLLQLTEAAKNIGERKWDAPLPPHGEDEVGMLSQTLGSMAKQLQELIGQLEQRVAERTQELNDALKGLKRSTREKEKISEELRVAQRLEAIGQLAAGIAHEINTPAQFVGDNLEFLRNANEDQAVLINKYLKIITRLSDPVRDEQLLLELETVKKEVDIEFLDEEVPSALANSLEGVKQISKIVRSIKDFSHPGQETKQTVDVNRAIEATMTVARSEWKYVAEIETNLGFDLPTIDAHASELNQVFLNMIVNAAHAIGKRKADDPKSGPGRIYIGTKVVGQRVEVCIRDNGCGIPKDIIDRVFDPFFTTKEVGKGTGQGLAIAHRIVTERHDGTIKINSEAGKFTEFKIYLSITSAESNEAEIAVA